MHQPGQCRSSPLEFLRMQTVASETIGMEPEIIAIIIIIIIIIIATAIALRPSRLMTKKKWLGVRNFNLHRMAHHKAVCGQQKIYSFRSSVLLAKFSARWR
jgi:carbon starvation protein CstA